MCRRPAGHASPSGRRPSGRVTAASPVRTPPRAYAGSSRTASASHAWWLSAKRTGRAKLVVRTLRPRRGGPNSYRVEPRCSRPTACRRRPVGPPLRRHRVRDVPGHRRGQALVRGDGPALGRGAAGRGHRDPAQGCVLAGPGRGVDPVPVPVPCRPGGSRRTPGTRRARWRGRCASRPLPGPARPTRVRCRGPPRAGAHQGRPCLQDGRCHDSVRPSPTASVGLLGVAPAGVGCVGSEGVRN